MVVRKGWEEYFMEIAKVVSIRSTCQRRQVGAVLTKDNHVLSVGYNGAPSGLHHCLDIGCLREKENVPSGQRHELCRALHAEQNALLQAALHGVSVKEAVLYCTHHPCSLCAKMLVNAGVRKILYAQGYPDPLASEILEEARLERLRLSIGEGERKISEGEENIEPACNVSGICVPLETGDEGQITNCIYCGAEMKFSNGDWKHWSFEENTNENHP